MRLQPWLGGTNKRAGFAEVISAINIVAMAHHALLIANNLYADPLLSQLEGAEKDAQELYALFKRELGYQAQVLLGPSRDQVHEAVEELGRRVHAGDTVLFYFSGTV
jgi:hypothetical protein